jgi:predicted dehydrogenase
MTLRIGILGAARVATYAMVAAVREVEGVIVQAVAARDPARAQAYAAEHGIAKVYPDYQSLIDADDVDAVYVALPPNLHARWSIAALVAGKPVLCEKPFALTMADAEAMAAAEAAHGGLLMEAQHSHYHPLSAQMRAMVAGGMLGDIEAVQAAFTIDFPPKAGELRFDRLVGGGALWDLGVYPLYWARSALGSELSVTAATQRWLNDDLAEGADIATQARLVAENGARITIDCAFDQPFAAAIRFAGSRGWLDIRNPLAPQRGHEFRWMIDGQEGAEEFTALSTYANQLTAFRDAVQLGTPITTRGADSLATLRLMATIDNLARSETAHAD